jgi:formyl-CoA transferase
MLDFQAARWLIDKEVPRQAGNNHPTSIPTGVYTTKDGHINIATTGQPTWSRLCSALGATALMDEPDYANAAARSKNRDALNAKLGKIFATKTSAQWIEMLNNAGVPCGPIYGIDEMFADPQVQHLGIVQSVDGGKRGILNVLRQPMSLSRTPSNVVAPTPERGEHTNDVLAEFGFSDAEIAALRQANAI